MIRGYDRVRESDTTAVLNLGAQIVDDSGIASTLQQRLNAASGGRGRPSTLPQYTVRAVLIAWFHLVYSGKPPSAAEMVTQLWFDYTDEHLEILGLPAWRDPLRAQRMKSCDATRVAEYNRLSDFLDRAFEPIDDTPTDARTRVTNKALHAAYEANAERVAQRRQERDHLLNNLVAASIDPATLRQYRGHIAVDEHKVGMSMYDDSGTKPGDTHGGTPMSGMTPKHRRLRFAWAIGLTCAITTSKPGDPAVPQVALGIGFDTPSAASQTAALTSIDAADNSEHMPATPATHRKWVIGDMAYEHMVGFNEALLERKRPLLMRYPQGNTTVFDLRTDPGDQAGPTLFNGVIICPGIDPAALRRERLPEIDPDSPADELHARDQVLKRLASVTMPTNGRPVRAEDRPAGRPRKDGPKPRTVFKVEVQCPAAAGKTRCPLVPESMKLDPATHHLATPPASKAGVCQRLTTTVRLTPPQFKTYSPLMEGAWEHDDFYSHARALNEAYHARLTSPNGGNLNDRTITLRRNSLVATTIALAVAATNVKQQAAWRGKHHHRLATPPRGRRYAVARRREARISAYARETRVRPIGHTVKLESRHRDYSAQRTRGRGKGRATRD